MTKLMSWKIINYTRELREVPVYASILPDAGPGNTPRTYSLEDIMKFLLIIWIYQSNIYYEVEMPTMAECRRHEDAAHKWGIPIVTECKTLK